MIIEIEDGLSYRGAILNFKYVWLKKQLANNSISSTARKIGITRKGLQLLNKISPEDFGKMKAPIFKCVFCKKDIEIHLHHIDGRKHSNELEIMCADCHKLFHAMNNRYQKP